MKLPKNKTSNTDVVEFYMTFGSPMNQLFVMEAIQRYAKDVVKHQEGLRESMKNHPIEPNAWIESAEVWLDLLQQRSEINNF